MNRGEFIAPDIVSSGPEINISSLPLNIIHLLARRAPNIIYGLDGSKRKKLDEYIANLRDIGATNILLRKMLTGFSDGISVKCRRVNMSLIDLIGEGAINSFGSNKGLARDVLLKQLQRMIFSEKSSFAQSGISISCVVEDV